MESLSRNDDVKVRGYGEISCISVSLSSVYNSTVCLIHTTITVLVLFSDDDDNDDDDDLSIIISTRVVVV